MWLSQSLLWPFAQKCPQLSSVGGSGLGYSGGRAAALALCWDRLSREHLRKYLTCGFRPKSASCGSSQKIFLCLLSSGVGKDGLCFASATHWVLWMSPACALPRV